MRSPSPWVDFRPWEEIIPVQTAKLKVLNPCKSIDYKGFLWVKIQWGKHNKNKQLFLGS